MEFFTVMDMRDRCKVKEFNYWQILNNLTISFLPICSNLYSLDVHQMSRRHDLDIMAYTNLKLRHTSSR